MCMYVYVYICTYMHIHIPTYLPTYLPTTAPPTHPPTHPHMRMCKQTNAYINKVYMRMHIVYIHSITYSMSSKQSCI